MNVIYKGTALRVKRKIGYSAILLFEIDFEYNYADAHLYEEMTATGSPFYFWALSEERLQKKVTKKSNELIEKLKKKYGAENVFPYHVTKILRRSQ